MPPNKDIPKQLPRQPSLNMSRSKEIEQSGILKRSQIAKPRNSEEVLQFLYQKQKEKQERQEKISKINEKEKKRIEEEEKQKEQ